MVAMRAEQRHHLDDPWFDGAIPSLEWQDALWNRFAMEALRVERRVVGEDRVPEKSGDAFRMEGLLRLRPVRLRANEGSGRFPPETPC